MDEITRGPIAEFRANRPDRVALPIGRRCPDPGNGAIAVVAGMIGRLLQTIPLLQTMRKGITNVDL